MTLRSILSVLSILVASSAFLATSAPPIHNVTKQEQANTITLSPQNPSVTKRVKVAIDPKMIARSVEKNLREDSSMLAVSLDLGAWPSGLSQDVLVEFKRPDGTPITQAPSIGRWREPPGKDIIATIAPFDSCDWETICEVEVLILFSMSNLTEEVTLPWLLRVYLNGMKSNKNAKQQNKADNAVQVSISE